MDKYLICMDPNMRISLCYVQLLYFHGLSCTYFGCDPTKSVLSIALSLCNRLFARSEAFNAIKYHIILIFVFFFQYAAEPMEYSNIVSYKGHKFIALS
mgnify:CR=1 FL=1